MEKKLRQIEKLLLEVFDELNENFKCNNLELNLWHFKRIAEIKIWNGSRHLNNSDGSVIFTIDDVLALIKSPERKILFRRFSKVS